MALSLVPAVRRWRGENYAEYGKARDAMLDATHKTHAPWALVNFNYQRRGRLAMIRHLLDQIPVHKVPESTIEFPPLGPTPLLEKFAGPLRPI